MLDSELVGKYNSEIAGKTIHTFSNGGWKFGELPGESEEDKGVIYHYCLESLTAPYTFALDEKLRVFVDDFGNGWVKLFESVFGLFAIEKKFSELAKNKTVVEPYGMYRSLEEIEDTISDDSKLTTFKASGESLSALYYDDELVIKIGRVYSVTPELKALRYR